MQNVLASLLINFLVFVLYFFFNRRKLEEIPNQYHLHPAKGLTVLFYFSTNRIYHRKRFCSKHRYFVNYQTFVRRTRRLTYSPVAILSKSYLFKVSLIPIPLQECIVIPPICVAAMPVLAVIAWIYFMLTQISDIFIYSVSFPRSRFTSQKNICAGFHYP